MATVAADAYFQELVISTAVSHLYLAHVYNLEKTLVSNEINRYLN